MFLSTFDVNMNRYTISTWNLTPFQVKQDSFQIKFEGFLSKRNTSEMEISFILIKESFFHIEKGISEMVSIIFAHGKLSMTSFDFFKFPISWHLFENL